MMWLRCVILVSYFTTPPTFTPFCIHIHFLEETPVRSVFDVKVSVDKDKDLQVKSS